MKMTPMLRQYLDLKEQAGSALLLYRMGDFYELFFEDAQQAAPVLGITLTRRRQNDSVDAPMCGVPHHAFDGYLGKLLDAGFRVAVAEQVEDPAKAKGLVKREVVEIITASMTGLLASESASHLTRKLAPNYRDATVLKTAETTGPLSPPTRVDEVTQARPLRSNPR